MSFQLNPKVTVSIVFVASLAMSIMDTTIVNVALPALSSQFGVPSTSIDAVIVGYMVSLAVIIPASGWLGDRWGTKRVFLLALILFTLASALCGLAINLPMLVAFRVLQGIGGGAMTPVGTTLLYRAFPQSERVRIGRILNIPIVIAPTVGPAIGGLLIEQLSWRWIFFINLPIGIATFLFGLLFLRNGGREAGAGRFDPAGFVLAGVGLGFFMYALTEGPTYGWSSSTVLTTLLAGLVLLAVFVVVELRVKEPMLDLRLLGERLFLTCNLVTLFSSAGFLGLLFAVPLFLQEAQGASPLLSGLTTFPEALGVVTSTQLISPLYARVGPRRLAAGGLALVTVAMSLFFFSLRLDTDPWVVRVLIFLTGAGMGCTFIPVNTAAFAKISHEATGKASALANAQRQIGSALGIALISTVLGIAGLTRVDGSGIVQPNLAAYHLAFLTSAALALISVFVALAIRDRDAAATMQSNKAGGEAAQLELPMEI